MSRYAKPKHQPMAVRLRVAQRAAIERVAAQRGIGISTLLREIIEPYLATVDGTVNIPSILATNVPSRSVIAPANRARIERLASGSGFADRLK